MLTFRARNILCNSGLLTVLPLVLFSGCRDKSKPVDEILSLEGTVEKLDAKADGTGKLTVSYRDKQDQPMVGSGEVNAETEIMINGALAKLADLKVGDRIRGDVKVIRQGKERRQVVLKVRVDRPEANKPPISP